MFHPAVLALEDSLKARRERAGDAVVSSSSIILLFPFQNHIDGKSKLLFKDTGTKIVCVDLNSKAERYAVTNDNEEFEELRVFYTVIVSFLSVALVLAR